MDKPKEIKKIEIELLKQEIQVLKNALCICPHDGRSINCPIHGYKMYGDAWIFRPDKLTHSIPKTREHK